MNERRLRLAVRTILVTWRGVMGQIQRGHLREGHGYGDQLTRRALSALDRLSNTLAGATVDPELTSELEAARTELRRALSNGAPAGERDESRMA